MARLYTDGLEFVHDVDHYWTDAEVERWWLDSGSSSTNCAVSYNIEYGTSTYTTATLSTDGWHIYSGPVQVEPDRIQTPETKAASERAEELLLSILSEEERQEYRNNQSVTIEALGKKYRLLKNGFANNILELDEQGKPVAKLCAAVADKNIPLEDNLLAQVLALRANPQMLLGVANRSTL